MRTKDLSSAFLPTDRRWQCTRRSCGCWRSVHQSEPGARPRCPICGSEMKLTTHAEAGKSSGGGYPVFFYAVSAIGAVALLLLLIFLMLFDGRFQL